MIAKGLTLFPVILLIHSLFTVPFVCHSDREKSRLPGSNSRPNVSEGYEVPLSYRGDRHTMRLKSKALTAGGLVQYMVTRACAEMDGCKFYSFKFNRIFSFNLFQNSEENSPSNRMIQKYCTAVVPVLLLIKIPCNHYFTCYAPPTAAGSRFC